MYQQNQTFRVTVIIKTVLVVLGTPAQLLGSSGGAKLQTYEYRIGSVEADMPCTKMDGWKTILSCWVPVNFQGRAFAVLFFGRVASKQK